RDPQPVTAQLHTPDERPEPGSTPSQFLRELLASLGYRAQPIGREVYPGALDEQQRILEQPGHLVADHPLDLARGNPQLRCIADLAVLRSLADIIAVPDLASCGGSALVGVHRAQRLAGLIDK